MPSPKPSPRRAPARSSKIGSRTASSGSGAKSSGSIRPKRGAGSDSAGAEKSKRTTGAPSAHRHSGERPFRRFDDDDVASRSRGPKRTSSGRAQSSTSERDSDRPSRPTSRRTGSGTTSRPERDGSYSASGRPVRGAPRGAARSGARPVRVLTPEEIERKRAAAFGQKKGWGGVARKGGVNIRSTGQEMAVTRSKSGPAPQDQWVEDARPSVTPAAAKAKARVKYALPGDIASDIRKAFIGTSYMREKTVATLTRAAEAYDRKRYEEALRLGRTVADAVPGVAPVRELTGLAAYRADRWNMAKIHLTAYFTITEDPEHLPLVMDCDRASRRYRAVEKVFEQLESSEPTAEVLTEGRIVMAAAWADQKRYAEAIDLLTKAGGTKQLRNPSYRHVRLWYALADVFDRAGDIVSARELFARVVLAEPEAYDASSRLAELGATAPRKNRKRRTTPVSKKKVD